MAKNKTTKTDVDVNDFINSIADEKRKKDSLKLIEIVGEVTGFKPYMYGPSIIGFGNYHYKYASGHEGDAPLAGFSPRKAAISLYFAKFPGRDKLLKQFGKHKEAVACIYIKSIDEINIDVFKELTRASMKHTQKQYPGN